MDNKRKQRLNKKIISAEDYDIRLNWENLEKEEKEYYHNLFQRAVNAVIQKLSPIKDDIILDLGCSIGTLVYHLTKCGICCIGVDYSLKSLVFANFLMKKNKKNIAGNYFFIRADARSLPFNNNTFDKVVNMDFLEHIYNSDKQKIIEEIFRILKPGGRVVSFTPNLTRLKIEYFIQFFKCLCRGKILYFQKGSQPFDTELHVGLENPGSLKKVFLKCGFKKLSVDFIDYNIPLISKIFPKLKILPEIFGAQTLLTAQK